MKDGGRRAEDSSEKKVNGKVKGTIRWEEVELAVGLET